MLIAVSLVRNSLFLKLLVVHGIGRLVDGIGASQFFHFRHSSLLTNVKSDLSDVRDLSIDEFLVECSGRTQLHIYTL